MPSLVRAAVVASLLVLATSALALDLENLFQSGTETRVTSGQGGPNINQAQAEAYNGPKARVAVARFTNKAGGSWWRGGIGVGMADQLATALFNTNRYILLERQNLDSVLAEQDLGASGRTTRATSAPIGQIEGAELLIVGAVTEFEADAGGTQIRGGGTIGQVLGALAGATQKAHIAIDIRVIDAKTSRILAVTSVEGTASDVDVAGALGGYWGDGALSGALSSWENTPKEKALRQCIDEAVKFIVSKTPPVYYRHGQGAVRKASVPSSSGSSVSRNVPRYQPGAAVSVKSSTLNVRSGAGSGNPVVFQATSGARFEVLGQQGNWLNIRDGNGQTGWVAGWLVSPAAAAASGGGQATRSVATPATPTPPAEDDIVKRLERLKSLHDKGLITEEEYAKKRDEILSAL